MTPPPTQTCADLDVIVTVAHRVHHAIAAGDGPDLRGVQVIAAGWLDGLCATPRTVTHPHHDLHSDIAVVLVDAAVEAYACAGLDAIQTALAAHA